MLAQAGIHGPGEWFPAFARMTVDPRVREDDGPFRHTRACGYPCRSKVTRPTQAGPSKERRDAMILVTGATGFVGKAVVQAVSGAGLNGVVAVRVLPSSGGRTENGADGLQWQAVGDINSQTDWQRALQGVQTVVHCAARAHVMREHAADALAVYREVNVQGTLRLARQAVAAGVKRLVFVSSVKVNGEATQPGMPFLPDGAAAPQDAYGVSKWEAEQGLRQIAADTGLEVVVIRPPLVYGPGVKANFAALMRVVQRGYPLPLALVRNQRSLVGLGNLTDFIVTCATHPKAANQTFLVSDGQDLSTPDLIRQMALAAGVSARLLPVPVWALQGAARLLGKGDAVQRLCGNLQVDISKARERLGWVPPVSVQEGLRVCFGDGDGSPRSRG